METCENCFFYWDEAFSEECHNPYVRGRRQQDACPFWKDKGDDYASGMETYYESLEEW